MSFCSQKFSCFTSAFALEVRRVTYPANLCVSVPGSQHRHLNGSLESSVSTRSSSSSPSLDVSFWIASQPAPHSPAALFIACFSLGLIQTQIQIQHRKVPLPKTLWIILSNSLIQLLHFVDLPPICPDLTLLTTISAMQLQSDHGQDSLDL